MSKHLSNEEIKKFLKSGPKPVHQFLGTIMFLYLLYLAVTALVVVTKLSVLAWRWVF